MDLSKIRKQTWQPRTRVVDAAALGDGEKWTVRAPSANDLAMSNEAQSKRERLDAMVSAIEGGKKSEIIDEMRAALGLGDDVRPDIARRIELLVRCSVDPVCGEEDAVWLGNNHPVLFYALSNAILELAGQGAEVKKTRSASTKTRPSDPP